MAFLTRESILYLSRGSNLADHANSSHIAVFRQFEIPLHSLNDSRHRFAGFITIGSAEFNALNRPICVVTRFRRFWLDNNANESLAIWLGFPYRLSDCRLQIRARNRNSVIEQSHCREPNQDTRPTEHRLIERGILIGMRSRLGKIKPAGTTADRGDR
jgi:hypothetical protein